MHWNTRFGPSRQVRSLNPGKKVLRIKTSWTYTHWPIFGSKALFPYTEVLVLYGTIEFWNKKSGFSLNNNKSLKLINSKMSWLNQHLINKWLPISLSTPLKIVHGVSLFGTTVPTQLANLFGLPGILTDNTVIFIRNTDH